MIENNPISSSLLTSKSADDVQMTEKKTNAVEKQSLEKTSDKAEVSEGARLLAKATAALNEQTDIQNEEVQQITQQVQDGIYEVPVNKLASVLIQRLFTTD
jgi:anti-sigma28 factor (negative regulator of flagellin synthesis)